MGGKMTKTITAILGSMLTAGALMIAPVQAQSIELTTEERAELDEFVLGAATAMMLHEVGHMLVGELEFPVIAREEDVADTIATLILLMQDDEDNERAVRYLEAFVTNWFLFGRDEYGAIDDVYVADEHSLSRQRAFAGVCLAHGSGHPAFAGYAERHGLNENRMARCERDYEQAMASFSTLLAPHALDEGSTQTSKANIEYAEAEGFEDVREMLMAANLLEELAEMVFDEIAMPRDITFAADECGMANAFYSADGLEGQGLLVLCYELLGELADGYVDGIFNADEENPETPMDALVRTNEAACPADTSCSRFKI